MTTREKSSSPLPVEQAPAPWQQTEERGWLIERYFHGGELRYWTGRKSGTFGDWDPRHQEAIRFARRADAEAMLTWHLDCIGRVVEHMWAVPVEAPAQEPVTRVKELEREVAALKALLERIYKWDMMDSAADGNCWRGEIDILLHGREERI